MRIPYQLCRPAYAALHRPSKAHPDDAGIDLRAATTGTLVPGEWSPIPTGIRLALPRGWEAQIRPRSGLAAAHGVTVLNTPGTIDAGFRGEIRAILINHGDEPWSWEEGDRIAQMVITQLPHAVLTETEHLNNTTRGDHGLGSTGIA